MAGIETAVEAARRYIIKRPRLTRLLDNANARALMLIAPAGFGKTTLAREWAAERPHLWYRGTSATADVAALAASLADTISGVIPEAGTRAVNRMRATGTPEDDVAIIAELFAEDLAEWPADLWLVFDDYQFAMEAKAPERFIDLLLRKSPVHLLLTSRRRPSWASARRLLYGELYELGRNELAMDHEEAASVLAHRKDAPAAGLVALAEGWPAVIGLAALTEEIQLPEGGLPDALYEYFAEELYQAAAPELQRGLGKLSLAPSLGEGIAEFLLGETAAEVISDGVRLGFLTPRSGNLELHPLLRTFLDSKTRERTAENEATAERLAQRLAELGAWDDAFPLVNRFFSEVLFVALLESGLPALLREARLSTLARWLELGRARQADVPVVDLAEAELAFHQGERRKAETLAIRAARRLGSHHTLRSRAFYVAGVSARMDFHGDRAKAFFDEALKAAKSTSDERDAIWGELSIALDLDLPNADEFHSRLIELDDGSIDGAIRVAVAQFTLAIRKGYPIGDSREMLDASSHLIPRTADPHSISSHMACRSSVLILQGNYREAFAEAAACEAYAKDVRLPFVVGYAKRARAMAELGLRHFGRCKQLIDWLDQEALQREDIFLQLESRLTRTRLLLAEGQTVAAAVILSAAPSRFPYEGERAEWLATLALVRACAGDREGMNLAREAEEISSAIEVRTLVPMARAIYAIASGSKDANCLAVEAFETTAELGSVDPFVAAYRGYPPLLSVIAKETRFREEVSSILENAHDESLARASGFPMPAQRQSRRLKLSSREQEVLGLIAQGLTNKEIATALFVSEATAKVHVSHILEKLGVRSRTEAALRAAEIAEID